MKRSKISRGIPIGCVVEVADNSAGIKTAKIIGVFSKGGHKKRLLHARIGDVVKLARKKKMYEAVVIRTKMGVYRMDQDRHYRYDDNAVAMVDMQTGKLKGTRIKGVICKQAFDLYPGLTNLRAKVL
jgi:ribosomal protein L14